MSRAAKMFLGTSVTFMGVTIWGVHWMQQRESDVRDLTPSLSAPPYSHSLYF